MRRTHIDEPMLITSAPVSADDEYDRRRKKYAVMMTIRLLCVVAAGLTYTVSVLLALAFMLGGMVLPWCAVMIANDGPVKKRVPAPHHRDLRSERALMPAPDDDRTVDG